MMRALALKAICAAAVAVVGASAASAQVKVSVTLSGSVDEMLPILQHLRDMGFGDAAEIEVEGGEEADAIRMSVHSVMSSGEEPAEEAPPQAPAQPKGLSLSNAKFDPATAKGGEVALLTVSVSDPEQRVDTVAAKFRDRPDATFDLFDNGTQGDRTVGDGVWSRRVPVFPQLQTGQHVVEITAFDVNGQPVGGEDGAPIKADTILTVTK